MAAKMTFFRSYWEAARMLPDDERGRFLEGILAYAFDGEEPDFEGVLAMAWVLVKPNLDSSARQSEAGRRGGAKQADEDSNKGACKGASKGASAERPKGACKGASANESKGASEKNLSDKDKEKDREKDREVEVHEPLEVHEPSTCGAGGEPWGALPAPPRAAPSCPVCDGAMRFDVERRAMVCGLCGTELGPGDATFRKV